MKVKKILLCVSCVILLAGCGEVKIDPNQYSGVGMSAKWDVRSTCQTARVVLKEGGRFPKYKIDELYKSKCTVNKLTGSLLGWFSHLTSYSVTWPNGISARTFVDSDGAFRMMGNSDEGVPESWN